MVTGQCLVSFQGQQQGCHDSSVCSIWGFVDAEVHVQVPQIPDGDASVLMQDQHAVSTSM